MDAGNITPIQRNFYNRTPNRRSHDAFGHTLRTAKQGFESGSWIYADSTYDELGRVLTQSVPHYSTDHDFAQTAYTGYDVLGRPTQKIIPTADGTRTVTMTYTGLKIAYTDTDNATQVEHDYTHYYDGLGKGNGHLVQVDQKDDDGDILTATYRYDAGGNLVLAHDPDPSHPPITATYDGFGDKLSLNDPDKGQWSYRYDGYGELVKTTDALHHTINTTYDKLGRKTLETDATDHRQSHWTYDTAAHGKGKLAKAWVTDTQSGNQLYAKRYYYDAAGRATASEVTPTGGPSYFSRAGYDAKGRPKVRSYPALNGGTDHAPTLVGAEASPAAVEPGTEVTLSANATDPDGTWNQWGQTRLIRQCPEFVVFSSLVALFYPPLIPLARPQQKHEKGTLPNGTYLR